MRQAEDILAFVEALHGNGLSSKLLRALIDVEKRERALRERDEFLAKRKEAGLLIDPETAEVSWTYAHIVDPYGIEPDFHEEEKCLGRVYFARAPGSDVWVSFYQCLPGDQRRPGCKPPPCWSPPGNPSDGSVARRSSGRASLFIACRPRKRRLSYCLYAGARGTIDGRDARGCQPTQNVWIGQPSR